MSPGLDRAGGRLAQLTRWTVARARSSGRSGRRQGLRQTQRGRCRNVPDLQRNQHGRSTAVAGENRPKGFSSARPRCPPTCASESSRDIRAISYGSSQSPVTTHGAHVAISRC